MIYYTTTNQTNASMIIWGRAKSLTELGKKLAKHNAIWPDKSTEGKTITVGKRIDGHIKPVKLYCLTGDKLTKQ